MLILTKAHYKKIMSYSFNQLPNETCGLLAGTTQNGNALVEKIYCLTNVYAAPTRFRMNQKEQFNAARDMRLHGWVLLGNFHSHPNSPAIPSAEDCCFAFDSEILYTILSLKDTKPILRSFKIDSQKITEEKVQILL